MNIKELAEKYKLSQIDFWELNRSGKKIYIINHSTCEKIAAIENIELIDIKVLNSEWDFCRLIVTMKKDTKQIISFGEAQLVTGEKLQKKTRSGYQADKGNCESQYIGCMAEKRGVDRCILKLINAYEYDIFSEEEADEFKKDNDVNKKLDNANDRLDKALETRAPINKWTQENTIKFIDTFGAMNIDACDLDDFNSVKNYEVDKEKLSFLITSFQKKYMT